MQHVIKTSMCCLTQYHTFSVSVAWFGAIYNALPRVTIKFIKKININIFKRNDGNAW